MERQWEELRTLAARAARSAGDLLRRMQSRVSAREKGPADLVTEADLAAQEVIRSILLEATPDFAFLGEEDQDDQADSARQAELTWVVDPLDGTTNYVHGLDNYCVSLALCDQVRPLLGVVFDPVREELYWATRGEGAYLNGSRLRSSGQRQLEQALMAASFAARVARNSPEISRFVEVLHHCQAVRRFGSAALNLCYVAAGRLDGYWATSTKAWDVAAGVLCVEEAGGTVTGIDGRPFQWKHPHLVAAATESLQFDLRELLTRFPDPASREVQEKAANEYTEGDG
jgi:myo-inositol-1(or 4)-monophosphatase